LNKTIRQRHQQGVVSDLITLPTTVVPKEEFNDCKDDNDYQCEYECDYEYFEDGVDEEEKYFSKYRK